MQCGGEPSAGARRGRGRAPPRAPTSHGASRAHGASAAAARPPARTARTAAPGSADTCCRVLRCVAACCSVLQRVAACWAAVRRRCGRGQSCAWFAESRSHSAAMSPVTTNVSSAPFTCATVVSSAFGSVLAKSWGTATAGRDWAGAVQERSSDARKMPDDVGSPLEYPVEHPL